MVEPSSLFGSGEYGYAFDPTDTSKVWQNVAGTTAGASGQPVGKLDDISGNNKHFTAAGDNDTRPTLQADGTILFDGIDDQLRRAEAGLYAAGACTVIALLKSNSPGNGKVLFGEGNSASDQALYEPLGTRSTGGTNNRFFARNDSGNLIDSNSGSSAPWDNSTHTNEFVDDGSSMVLVVDGTAGNTRSYTRSGTTTLNQTSIGARWRTGIGDYMAAYVGRIVVIGRELTAQETTDMVAWVQASAAGGGTTHEGAAALAGSGTATASASAARKGETALAGTGALAASATLQKAAAAALSGAGSLAASAARGASATAALSGAGTLAASATRTLGAAASLSGAGSLTSAATRTLRTTTALAGGGTLATTATLERRGAAQLAGQGTLEAAVSATLRAAAALEGTGTLTAAGTLGGSHVGEASLGGTGTLAAQATLTRRGSAALAGTGAISAALSANRAGAAVLTGAGGISALARLEAAAVATLAGVGTLTATPAPDLSLPRSAARTRASLAASRSAASLARNRTAASLRLSRTG